ncbi:uncharacterized protein LOC143464428 [Clavelina lepadiformis]|uniref:Uncharacterized protein n=1 Tax=Clavelina lepadiformis TaxID=159417 RepID=A0ABP0EX12_CLALP
MMSSITLSLMMCLVFIPHRLKAVPLRHNEIEHRVRRYAAVNDVSTENMRLQLLRRARQLRGILHAWKDNGDDECRFQVPWGTSLADFASSNDAILHLTTGLTIFDQFLRFCPLEPNSLSRFSQFLDHLREYIRRKSPTHPAQISFSNKVSNSHRRTSFSHLCVTNIHDYIHEVLRKSNAAFNSKRNAITGRDLYRRYLTKCRR